jgi:hypothetical protein
VEGSSVPRYEIRLPDNGAIHVEAEKVRQGPGGELLIFGASDNPNGKPDVIPQGEWRGYGIPFVASKSARPSRGKSFSVRADSRNKRKDRPVKKRAKRRNALVSDLTEFIRYYVVMSDAQTLTVALWAIHTHCFDAFQQTPYLAVTSPEKQCGKSRLLEVVELLVHEPWPALVPSEAVLYRKIHLSRPTLLLDEVDTIFNPKNGDRYEGHRAVLNAGHRAGQRVPRCVGQTGKMEEFRVYSPKMLAGIGTLPDTIADRSVPIRLARKKPEDEVHRFFVREARPVAEAMVEKMVAWTEKNRDKLADARPAMPGELSDRMQEGCEPLIAIADALGYGPPARAALVELLTAERLDSQETMKIRLLRDIRAIFEAADKKAGKRVRGIPSVRLLERLHGIEDAPWGNYYGRVLEARDLSKLLGHYGIKPRLLHLGKKGNKEIKAKGYKRDDLADAWDRYAT